MTDRRPIVLDNGSGFLKCGYAGSHFPACVIPTCVKEPVQSLGSSGCASGAPRGVNVNDPVAAVGAPSCRCSVSQPRSWGGEEAFEKNHEEVVHPIKNGIIQDMAAMMQLWNTVFYERMHLDALNERRLLLSEVPLLSPHHRCALYETLFETYGFAALQSVIQGALSLFSSGLETGVAVECGDSLSYCLPVFEGYSISKANRRVDIGGQSITRYLMRLMMHRGCLLQSGSDWETVQRVKEQYCYVAIDHEQQRKLARETTTLEKTVTLPDGRTCVIGQERFQATEAFFQPDLIDIECDGLPAQIWNSLHASDIDVRTSLSQHVVLSGGSSMFPGLATRIERDIRDSYLGQGATGRPMHATKLPLCVESSPRRKYMVFDGGAMLAALTENVPEMWMTKAEWEDGGASAVYARFAS